MFELQLPGLVLVIDENGRLGRHLADYFRQRDQEAFLATDPAEGLRIFTDHDVRLVFCAFHFPHFPETNGITIWESMKKVYISKLGCFARVAARFNIQRVLPKFEFVIMDECGSDAAESIAREKGINWFLKKPVDRYALERLLTEMGVMKGGEE